jgi:hypothetical protein
MSIRAASMLAATLPCGCDQIRLPRPFSVVHLIAPGTPLGSPDLVHSGDSLHELVVLAFLITVSLGLSSYKPKQRALACFFSPRISMACTMSCADICLEG